MTIRVGRMFERDGIWYEFLRLIGPHSMHVRRSGYHEILCLPVQAEIELAPVHESSKASSAQPVSLAPQSEFAENSGRRRRKRGLPELLPGHEDAESTEQREYERIKAEAEELIPELKQARAEAKAYERIKAEAEELIHSLSPLRGETRSEVTAQSDEVQKVVPINVIANFMKINSDDIIGMLKIIRRHGPAWLHPDRSGNLDIMFAASTATSLCLVRDECGRWFVAPNVPPEIPEEIPWEGAVPLSAISHIDRRAREPWEIVAEEEVIFPKMEPPETAMASPPERVQPRALPTHQNAKRNEDALESNYPTLRALIQGVVRPELSVSPKRAVLPGPGKQPPGRRAGKRHVNPPQKPESSAFALLDKLRAERRSGGNGS